jgi:hypothetical protein
MLRMITKGISGFAVILVGPQIKPAMTFEKYHVSRTCNLSCIMYSIELVLGAEHDLLLDLLSMFTTMTNESR